MEYALARCILLDKPHQTSIRPIQLGAKHDGREGFDDALDGAEAVDDAVEFFRRIGAQHGAQVVAAADGKQLADFVAARDGLDDLVLALGVDGDEHHGPDAGAALRGGDADGVAGDDAGAFQRLEAQLHGAARAAQGLGQLDDGQAGIDLEQVDQLAVEGVERGCAHGVSFSLFRYRSL